MVMSNPRLVQGRPGMPPEFGVRALAGGRSFHIYVRLDALGPHDRLAVEDGLVEEAKSLIRKAEASTKFDWERYGFRQNAAVGTLERTLSALEVDHLMRG